MIEVELPNGQELEFPDGTSPEVMRKAIEKQFPQYAKPKEEQPQEAKGWQGVLEDIFNAPGRAGMGLYEAAKHLPQQAFEATGQLAKNPIRAAENLGAGLASTARGVLNTPSYLSQYLKNKGITNTSIEELLPEIEKTNYSMGSQQPGDTFIRGIGSYLPAGYAGGIQQGLKGLTQRAGANLGYGASQNQDPLTAALLGLTGEAGVNSVPKAISVVNELRPSIRHRGNLPIEEIQANARAAENTNTPLGKILEEPKLTGTFENVTSRFPLAGGKDILSKIKNQVENKAEQVLENIKPEGAVGDFNNLTQSLLKDAEKKQKNIKNEMYGERNAIAEKEGHTLELPTFEKLAKKESKAIKKSALYMNDSAFRSAYNKLRGYTKTSRDIPAVKSSILDMQGNPVIIREARKISPTLTEAQVTANTLGEKAKAWKKSPNANDKAIGGMVESLAMALRKDIKSSVAKGSPELQQAHATANKNFAENYSPFLDKSIYKKLRQENPEKIINEIIKPGKKNDQYVDIQNVVKLLPDEQKNLLGYAYLKSAENKLGKIEPKKLSALIESLGNRQFEKLFPDEKVRQSLLDYGKLRGMNEKSLNVNFNPDTGIGLLPTMLGMGLITHPVKFGAALVGSRYKNKQLTSPAYRENLINKMIENSKKNQSATSKNKMPTALAQALMAAQSQQNKQSKEE